MAEMVGLVDLQKDMDFWCEDNWTECFPVRWHMVKDVPNGSLQHITLQNIKNKPVTHSRDTQEVSVASPVLHGTCFSTVKLFDFRK
jgi:hypothetical protein